MEYSNDSNADNSIDQGNSSELEKNEITEERWCSWCFHKVPHELIKKSTIWRNSYRCTHCFRLSLYCMKCNVGMCRQFPGYWDKLCASCDGTLKQNWSETEKEMPIPEDMQTTKWCSWCFTESNHILQQKNYIKRNSYQCQTCSKQSLHCRKCSIAMSRRTESQSDHLCAKCDGTITDWSNVDIDSNPRLRREGWCSWCFEKTNHKMDLRNIVRRNLFHCESCSMETLPCMMCTEGMTRGGSAWDDSICAECSRETGKGGWIELKNRKDTMLNSLRNRERVIGELTRESIYRDKAKEQGLLRPFLLLVAMPPIFRNQVACFLGWSIFTSKCFGDPHAESWKILNAHRSGMQARVHHSYEKINPFVSNCNWYDILVRVASLGFQKDFSKNVPWKTTSDKANDSKDDFVQKIEEEFFIELNKLMKSQMTEEQRDAFVARERMIEDNIDPATRGKFLSNTGVTSTEAVQYAYQLVNQMFGLSSSVASIFIVESSHFLTSFGGTVGATIAVDVLAPLATQMALLSTPLFFIGIFGLVKTGFMMAFGSTEGRVFIPVILILNQRLLLAAEGLRIEDYY